MRLQLSIEHGIKNYGKDKEIIVMTHYPPYGEFEDIFVDIMANYNVKTCIYGHLHGKANIDVSDFGKRGICFRLVSCDYLNFQLLKIL